MALVAGAFARADNTSLTHTIPACSMPAATVLPEKYLKLGKADKQFAWALKAKSTDKEVSGSGWESIDGSSMRDWFHFIRADLNNDGICDWFVNAVDPVSTGGDHDSINTIYLGQPKGWLRIGATLPDTKPDALGFGDTDAQHDKYLFGEDISLLYDTADRTHYVITNFVERHQQYGLKPGYRIFAWDRQQQNLRLLDKWEPGSKAAGAYAYFKQHGATSPTSDDVGKGGRVEPFDPDIEALEIRQACNRNSVLWSYNDGGKSISVYLLAQCKP